MEWPTLETFGRRPRDALMWVPRALDVARIAAACAGGRAVDVGAGTGLLARLLADAGVGVDAYEPRPPRVTYFPLREASAEALDGPWSAAVVSWMEAGEDYRKAVARLAPVVVNAYDVEGGCGVMGRTDFRPYGFEVAASWTTPSFEDVAFALDRPGRALRRKGHPGNRVDILTSDMEHLPALREAVHDARPTGRLPWEDALDAAGL